MFSPLSMLLLPLLLHGSGRRAAVKTQIQWWMKGPFQSLHYICSLPFRYVDYMVPILLLYKEYYYWVSSPIVSHHILENNAFSITCTMAMEMECLKLKYSIISYFDRRQFQEKYKQLAFGKKARKRNINHQNSNNDAVLAKSFWIFHPLFILHYGLSQSINKTLMVPNFQPTRLFGFLLFSNAAFHDFESNVVRSTNANNMCLTNCEVRWWAVGYVSGWF